MSHLEAENPNTPPPNRLQELAYNPNFLMGQKIVVN